MEDVNIKKMNTKHNRKKTFLNLYEIFGEVISANIISRVCCDCKWDFDSCVQVLIKHAEDNSKDILDSSVPKGAIPKNTNNMIFGATVNQYSSTMTTKANYLSSNNIHKQTEYSKIQQDFQDLPNIKTVTKHIDSGHKIMIIMRGAPGSGKSYLAKKIIDLTVRGDYKEFIHSTDNYLYNSNGNYCYDPQGLADAHEHNQNLVKTKAMEGWSPIIVDNTNTKIWEMLPYVKIAIQNGYLIEILQPNTPWSNSALKLSKKNVHGVPKKKIEHILNNFEPIDKNKIVEMIKTVSYAVSLPQMRNHPNISFHLDVNSENVRNSILPKTTNLDALIDLSNMIEKSSAQAASLIPSHDDDKKDKSYNTSQYSKSKIIENVISKDKDDYKSIENQQLHIFSIHALNCPNENKLFYTIRQIYPNKNVYELWKLFVKCNGVIDCVVNILLNDDNCLELNSQSQNTNNFFTCNCDSQNIKINQESDINLNRINKISKLENIEYPKKQEAINEQFQLEEFSGENGSGTDVGNDLYEINLGKELVKQLESIFGLDIKLKESLTNCHTNIFMPKLVAKQLYDLWMESLYNQIEEQKHITIKDDEAFAKFLETYLLESDNLDVDVADNIELAWFKYNSNEQYSNNSARETMEYYSHLIKLFQTFPQIQKDTIIDVFQAQGNRFDETIMVLNNSVNTFDCNKLNVLKSNNVKTYSEQAKRTVLRDFEESRNHAAHHSQLKAECFEKAKEAIKRNSASVAVYYSHIANFHNTKIDMCNQKAANCIMEVNDWKQTNPDFIDLHYLHTMEAIESLDLFLDKHINKLKNISRIYKYIFIITGRGLHSAGGISTIKNKVKTRLKDRNLKWSEVNPGLLKVKLFSSSKFSNNC